MTTCYYIAEDSLHFLHKVIITHQVVVCDNEFEEVCTQKHDHHGRQRLRHHLPKRPRVMLIFVQVEKPRIRHHKEDAVESRSFGQHGGEMGVGVVGEPAEGSC